MFFKNKNKKEKKVFKDVFKENTKIMEYGKKYYDYIDLMKKEIKKDSNSTYIHFRSKLNNKNPESNMAEGIFSIINKEQILNLKDVDSFQEIITCGLYMENIKNEEIHYFLKMFVSQVYKCIEIKYYHKQELSLTEVFNCCYGFESLFKKYNDYTESIIHNKNIGDYISKMYSILKIEEILKNIEKQINIIHKNNFDIIEILKNKPIELFDTNSIYNETIFYLLYKKTVSDLNLINSERIESDFKNFRIYVIFDNYPINFIREPYYYYQLRALGIKIIFPDSEDLSYCQYLNANSVSLNINDIF
tara:strand:+ start:2772 stop:3683 length:912 start_codon:yes stop_codon:yes gene_type:complete